MKEREMAVSKFFTAVQLDENLCKGCINCIKRCPTQAIRVRNGKAMITKEFPEVEYETFVIKNVAGIYTQSFAWVEDGHIHLIGWDYKEDDE